MIGQVQRILNRHLVTTSGVLLSAFGASGRLIRLSTTWCTTSDALSFHLARGHSWLFALLRLSVGVMVLAHLVLLLLGDLVMGLRCAFQQLLVCA